jgi:hypothetical protein
VEDTNDPDAAAYGYDLTQEIIPPKSFFPTTDIFTVLTVLEDAHTWHCCCCLKEPATTRPPKRHKWVTSYERPFSSYEKPFNENNYFQSWGEVNYTGDDPNRPPNVKPRDYTHMTRQYQLKEKHKKLAALRERNRSMDASMLLESDEHDRAEWRTPLSSSF